MTVARVSQIHTAPGAALQCRVLRLSDSDHPTQPFYLIVTDHGRGVFSVEGPMTDDRIWQETAREARRHQRRITCGPAGADPDALAAEYRRQHNLAGVPPGSIVRTLG